MNDYKAAFIEAVDDLIAEKIEDRSERMKAVYELTEKYIHRVGIRPDVSQLKRLADYILQEELTDSHPDKMTINDSPIMSATQEERRRAGEYALSLADRYDLDGVKRDRPTRRRRTAQEERFIDEIARERNRARSAQYSRDTSPGSVVRYQLRDTNGELKPKFTGCINVVAVWRDLHIRYFI